MIAFRDVIGSLVGPRWRIAEHDGRFDLETRTRCRKIPIGVRRDVAEIIVRSLNSTSPETSGTFTTEKEHE